MSTTPLRAAMVPVMRQMRAYFAPVNRVTETPTIFDPGLCGVFALNSPPAPWLDLGWVENFERWYDTPTDVVRSGAKALPAGQFRGPLEARVEFDFRQWGKLQMALAGGSEHMTFWRRCPGVRRQRLRVELRRREWRCWRDRRRASWFLGREWGARFRWAA